MKNTYDLLYLCQCAIHNHKPIIENLDLPAVMTLGQSHSLTALPFLALQQAEDTIDSKFYADIHARVAKIMLRTVCMDTEREDLYHYLEENEIWYMPLKGIILQEYYPDYATREMCDNDILYDVKKQSKVVEFFRNRGYDCLVGHGADDDFHKNPVYNFEMHRTLFTNIHDDALNQYYLDVKSRLLPDGSPYRYRFTDEDFYVYIIAHAYKHYSTGGTGMRILLDSYLYRQAKSSLKLAYIQAEEKKLGIWEFDKTLRSLSDKVLGSESLESRDILLTEEEKQMLAYMSGSGSYGITEQAVENRLAKESRLHYIKSRMMPDLVWYENYIPFLYRHQWLIPLYLPYRWLIRPFKNRNKILAEIQVLIRRKKDRGVKGNKHD